jgi:hypothetical protein
LRGSLIWLVPEEASVPDVELPDAKQETNDHEADLNHRGFVFEYASARQPWIVGVDLFGRSVVVVVTA